MLNGEFPAEFLPVAAAVAAFVLGCLLVWMVGQRKRARCERQHEETLQASQRDCQQVLETAHFEQLQWQNQVALDKQAAEQRRELAEQRWTQQEAVWQDKVNRGMTELAALHEERQTLMARLEHWRERVHQADSDSRALQTRLQERETHFQEQLQLLRENKEQLKLEFENLSNRIFDAKGQAFAEHNRVSLDAMLKPFQEQLGEFKHRVEDIHQREVRQKAELTAELQQLKTLNLQMSKEAHDLSTALRGQKKTQGNWGELMLENVLERSGLRLGQDYRREVSFSTDDGRRRPDVIVNLPQGRHLIIDAKVSLNAYQDYVNADDELVRKARMRDHVNAMTSRIDELAAKCYFDLPGLSSPELVFMFVPIESAFVEALKADSELFQRALQNNVLVATPTTLLTSLNIVRQLWRFEEQNRHSAELADRAAKFHDKLRLFLDSLNAIGHQLDKAQDTWSRAFAQLTTGRGNLISQALDFKELGVAVKSELPENFAEHSRLELMSEAELKNKAGLDKTA